ncbi:MAG: hypothetical protein DRP03_03735 [Candidatus Aenigmatarchaeota archaeon]|nr:MAG: hypothetical protein DRP03_03735 [Candidatus Aenigmarchaeota archaeon]
MVCFFVKDPIRVIEDKLRLLGLAKPSLTPKQAVQATSQGLRFYRAVCEDVNGRKVFFKCLLVRERGIKNRFLNEIGFLKTVSEHPGHPLFEMVPKVFDYSLSPTFPYIVCEFIRGASRVSEDRFSNSEIVKIARILRTIHTSPFHIFRFIPSSPLFGYHFLQQRLKTFLRNPLVESKLKEKTKKFICKERRILRNRKRIVKLTHGDFSEANLMFYKEDIKVIDWEHVHLRNPLYDLADFWIKRKNHREEQRLLVKEYFKGISKESYQALFRLAVVEICLRDLVFFWKILKLPRGKEFKEKMQNEARAYIAILEDTLREK